MSTEYVERVLDSWKLQTREDIVKLKQHDGLECETDLENTMPVHLGSFTLSISKRVRKIFIRQIIGFKTNNLLTWDCFR